MIELVGKRGVRYMQPGDKAVILAAAVIRAEGKDIIILTIASGF
jgi:hypothetical protein